MRCGRLLVAKKGCDDGGVSGAERVSKRFQMDAEKGLCSEWRRLHTTMREGDGSL